MRIQNRENALGIVVLAAVPLLLLVDSSAALWRGWTVRSSLDWTVVAGATVAVVVVICIASCQSGRAFLGRRRLQATVCLLATAFTWLAAECLMRSFAMPLADHPFHRNLPGNTSVVFRPLAGVMPGIDGESRFTVNSLGIRGPELPAANDVVFRILCIGGSTTECLYLDDDESWPHLLMDTLNRRCGAKQVWVGNLGVSGYSTVHHLEFLSKDKLWKQMDCVLFLVGANDFGSFLRSASQARGSSERQLRLHSVQPIWKGSVMLALIRTAHRKWLLPQTLVEDEAGRSYVQRRRNRRVAPLRHGMPNLADGLDQYEERVVRMIDQCQSHGVSPVFCTQPALYGDQMAPEMRSLMWLGDDGSGRYFRIRDLARGIEQYNLRLMDVCDRKDVRCIDLRSMNEQGGFFYDDYHFTEAGAREVGRLIAEGLASFVVESPVAVTPGPAPMQGHASAGGPR